MVTRTLARIWKHLSMTPWRVRRMFPRATLDLMERAIKESEATHGGEICFVVEGALHGAALYGGQSARSRALEVFSNQRLWDTEHRNGVLIYVLLADRAVEIIADRGVHTRVDTPAWEAICRRMEERFRQAEYAGGAVEGIRAVTGHLVTHFPLTGGAPRELPDRPVIL